MKLLTSEVVREMHSNQWEYVIASTPPEYLLFHLEDRGRIRVGAPVPTWRGPSTTHNSLPLIGLMVALMLTESDGTDDHDGSSKFVPRAEWQGKSSGSSNSRPEGRGGAGSLAGPTPDAAKDTGGHGTPFQPLSGEARAIRGAKDIFDLSVRLQNDSADTLAKPSVMGRVYRRDSASCRHAGPMPRTVSSSDRCATQTQAIRRLVSVVRYGAANPGCN